MTTILAQTTASITTLLRDLGTSAPYPPDEFEAAMAAVDAATDPAGVLVASLPWLHGAVTS